MSPPAHDLDAPLGDFARCHAGITRQLDLLAGLPALLEPAERARRLASQALAFFRTAVFAHHRDEERELFPAVLESAAKGAELDRVQTMIRRLVDEHREIERTWKDLEPGLKKVAKGQDADVDATALRSLVSLYHAHARFEETEFLPLSQAILARNANHLAALGMSLHLRHAGQDSIVPYI